MCRIQELEKVTVVVLCTQKIFFTDCQVLFTEKKFVSYRRGRQSCFANIKVVPNFTIAVGIKLAVVFLSSLTC